MFTEEDLGRQNCELGRPPLRNEDDIEQSIRDVGFRRDRDPTSNVTPVGHDHIIEIKLESLRVIKRHLRGVTT